MFTFSFIFLAFKHFSLFSLFLSLTLIENNEAQQTHFSIAIWSTFSKSKARKFKPASFIDAWIGVTQGFDLDLKPFFIASNQVIHRSGKRRECVMSAFATSSLQGIFMLLLKLPPLPKPLSFRPLNSPSFSSRLSLSSELKLFDFDFDFCCCCWFCLFSVWFPRKCKEHETWRKWNNSN